MAKDASGYVHESAGQLQERAENPEAAAEKAIVQEVIDNLQFVESYEDVQRRAEDEELEFEGVDMWGEEARRARDEQTDEATGHHIPPKPTISVNLLDLTIQQVVNEARQARLTLTVKPKTGIANTKTSNYFKGLFRTIQVESGALEKRIWALERAAKVGRGGYEIEADYANDDDFDIDLMIDRILDYSTVRWDPYGVRADRKDADWCMKTDWISERERLRRWPNKPIIPVEGAFEREDHPWFAVDPQNPANRRVRIVKYYRIERTDRELGYHRQTGEQWVDQMPADIAAQVMQGAEGTRRRTVQQKTVMIYVVDGSQILEKKPWGGRLIPIIEVIGKEYIVKGKRRWKGIIANAMDLNRAINVLISAATEVAGSMPRAPYIMYEGQDEGHEEMWDDAPVKNFTRLYVRMLEIDGKPAPLPQRQQNEPAIQGLLLLLRMMHEMYHAVTGSIAPSTRAVNPYDRSGKAIEALQRQGAAGTFNYLDNLATISMLYEGEVMLDAIPHYYDKPGRLLYVSNEDDTDEVAILIKRPFIRGPEGLPTAVPCPQCGGGGVLQSGILSSLWRKPETCPACQGEGFATKETMPAEWQGQSVEYVDFSEGKYSVRADLDKSFQQQQAEALAGMTELAKAAPMLVPMYADLWVRAMGFSGANNVADRIEAQNPALQTPEDLQSLPPKMRARFAALQQQHQQAMMALQQAQQMIETDAIKSAGQKEIAMIKGALQERLEAMKLQGKMLQVKAEGTQDLTLEHLRGRIEAMHQKAQHEHEILMQLLEELGAKEQERHSVELHDAAAARAAERAGIEADRDHQRTMEREERGDQRQAVLGAAADHRKARLAADADGRKGALAEQADERKGELAEAADDRKSEMAANADLRKGSLAAEADRRKGALAAEADDRAAALAREQAEREAKNTAKE